MIIFGTRSKVLSNKNNKTFTCNYCNTPNSIHIFKLIKYFHIFWIPIFPYSSSLITQCTHCKQVSYDRELTADNKQLLNTNFEGKTPFGYYAGLLIVGAFFLFAIVSVILSKV